MKCINPSRTRQSCSALTSEQCLSQSSSSLLFSEVTALWMNPLVTTMQQGHAHTSFYTAIAGNGAFHCLLPSLKSIHAPNTKKTTNGTGKVHFQLSGMWSRYDRVLSSRKSTWIACFSLSGKCLRAIGSQQIWTSSLSIRRFLVNQILIRNF